MTQELIALLLALIAVGAVAGFSSGMFGIGGGAVIVPSLFFAFSFLGYSEDIIMHMAVATSAAIIVVNAYRSVRSHHAHNAVDWNLLWPKKRLQSYALWIGFGSFLGALWIAPLMSGQVLTILFAVMSSLISMQFIFGRPDWRLRDTVPGGAARPITGSIIGVLSSLMGIGGGSLTVPLMSICGVPIHRAIGTASGFGLAISVPAAIGFIISGWSVMGRPEFSMGYVNVLGFVFVAASGFMFIPLGAKLAHKLSQRKLKLVFGICLLLVALNMARKALT